jgi:hypothetical protein
MQTKGGKEETGKTVKRNNSKGKEKIKDSIKETRVAMWTG